MALWTSQYGRQLTVSRRPNLPRTPAGRTTPVQDAARVRPALPEELVVRLLAYALAAGAAVVALLAALPAPGSDSAGLLALAGAGFLVALSIELFADHLPRTALPVLTGSRRWARRACALHARRDGGAVRPAVPLPGHPCLRLPAAPGRHRRPGGRDRRARRIAARPGRSAGAAARGLARSPRSRSRESELRSHGDGRASRRSAHSLRAPPAPTRSPGSRTGAASRRPSSWSWSAHGAPAPGSACWWATSTASSR